MTIKRTYNIAGLVQFEAENCIKGIFINPALPAFFDDTDNTRRPISHMVWWMRPFIVGSTKNGWALRCLDGGAWDRSTWLGDFKDLSEAVEAAHHALLHPKYISEAAPIPGMSDSFSMTPVEWEA